MLVHHSGHQHGVREENRVSVRQRQAGGYVGKELEENQRCRAIGLGLCNLRIGRGNLE